MKRFALILIILSFSLAAFCGCSSKPSIEDYEWTLRVAMHGDGNTLVIDAVESGYPTDTDARVVDVTLTARDGIITVIDKTNSKAYTGTYRSEGKNPEGESYKIELDGKEGHATVAFTTYASQEKEPTLPISICGYSLYFYAKAQ